MSLARRLRRAKPQHEALADMGSRLIEQHKDALASLVNDVRAAGHSDPLVGFISDDQIAAELAKLALGAAYPGSGGLYVLRDHHARMIMQASGAGAHAACLDETLPAPAVHVLVIQGSRMAHGTIVPPKEVH